MKSKSEKSLLSTLSSHWWTIGEENIVRYRIIRGFTNSICYLPKSVRKWVFFTVDNFAILMSRFFMIIGQASCIAYLISGKEKHSGEKLTILFISKKNLSPYISNLIFSKELIIKGNTL